MSGDSAGGLATYLHSHQWRESLPSATKVVALPDAGFFADDTNTMPMGCSMTYADSMRSIFEVANTSGGLPPGCLLQHATDPWECMLAKNAAPHIPMPTVSEG